MVALHRSRRGAGEQGEVTHARAPGGNRDAVSSLGSAKEVVEGCRRRRGEVRAAPVRGRLGVG
jgi:hypothetical protein